MRHAIDQITRMKALTDVYSVLQISEAGRVTRIFQEAAASNLNYVRPGRALQDHMLYEKNRIEELRRIAIGSDFSEGIRNFASISNSIRSLERNSEIASIRDALSIFESVNKFASVSAIGKFSDTSSVGFLGSGNVSRLAAFSALYNLRNEDLSQFYIDEKLDFVETILEESNDFFSFSNSLAINNRLTWEQWLSIAGFVFAIIIFLYEKYDSDAMQDALLREMDIDQVATNARLERISKLLEKLDGIKPDVVGPQYVVRARSISVRTSPDGRVIAVAYQNQIVTITEKNGKWLKFRYYDYVDGQLIEGWARKKHLQPVRGLAE